jgi:hypothetical protein
MLRNVRKFVIGLIFLTFLIAGTAGAADLDLSRLLLYWPCDEGGGDMLEDASGNGFNAQIGGSHEWEDGQLGGAVSLQNTSATVMGEVVSSTAETGEITMACWFSLRKHADYSGVLSVAHPSCDASCCYRMLINPGFSPFWNGGEHVDKSLGSFTFELDTWYHYVMVVADGMDRIYVDGELIGEQAGIDPPDFDEVTVLLGAGEGPGTHMIEDGVFDEAMIWDVALDEDQIGELMDGSYLAVKPVGKLAFTWGKIKQ